MAAPKKLTPKQRFAKHTIPFLACLLQCSEAEAVKAALTWQVFDDGPGKASGKAMVLQGSFGQLADQLERLNQDGCGIFISMGVTDLLGRKKENITAVRSAWADIDGKLEKKSFDPNSLKPRPTMLVRSGHGYHAHWVYSKSVPVDAAEREDHAALLRGIYSALAEMGADKKVCHATCVLRVPGTFNMKDPSDPILVELLHSDGPIYAPEEIAAVFTPDVPKPKATAPVIASQPCTLERGEILESAKAYALKIYAAISGNGGHTATFNAALKLTSGFDLSVEETLEVVREAYNPRCEPPWSEQELRHKCEDAYKRSMTDGNRGRLLDAIVQDAARDEVRKGLAKGDKGQSLAIPGNLVKILREDQQYGPRLSRNEMSLEICYDKVAQPDHFVITVQEQLQDNYHLNFPEREIRSKLLAQAASNPFHPVREYLNSRKWDGKERLTRVAMEILGTEPNKLYSTYLTKFFIAAVRRVKHPGCKVDTVLVLTGSQATLKSSFFDELGREFFNDSPIDMTNKDGIMVLHRAWISELAEIDHATSNTAVERMKAFISSRRDCFRAPYATSVEVHPRSCILVGTSNREAYLTDASGSRRFWTIKVTQPANLELLREWRDQLWAEAVGLELAGIDHWLSADDEAFREVDAEQHQCEDPLESKFLDWLDSVKNPRSFAGVTAFDPMEGISTARLMDVLDLPAGQQNRSGAMRLTEILKRHGWEPSRKFGSARLWAPTISKQAIRGRK